MTKTFINAAEMHPYKKGAHAVRVGNTIYVSGMAALDADYNIVGKDDFEAQAKCCFENMQSVLETAGASFSDLIYITCWLTNIDHYGKYQEVRSLYIKDHRFAGMTVAIDSLPMPDLMIELTGIAVVD